jgi:hypothetical protein
MTIPAVTVGEIPSSIKLPLLEAKMVLNHLKLSAESWETIPYKGIKKKLNKNNKYNNSLNSSTSEGNLFIRAGYFRK